MIKHNNESKAPVIIGAVSVLLVVTFLIGIFAILSPVKAGKPNSGITMGEDLKPYVPELREVGTVSNATYYASDDLTCFGLSGTANSGKPYVFGTRTFKAGTYTCDIFSNLIDDGSLITWGSLKLMALDDFETNEDGEYVPTSNSVVIWDSCENESFTVEEDTEYIMAMSTEPFGEVSQMVNDGGDKIIVRLYWNYTPKGA